MRIVRVLLSSVFVGGSIFAQETSLTRMVEIDGHKLRVRTAGKAPSGLPTVIFENGMGTLLERWGPVQPEISKITATFSYDRAGIGRSEPGREAPTFPHIVSELHAVLEKSGVGPPYLLVGHSLGGPIIRLFTALYPDQVAGLVYIDPGDFSGTEGEPVVAISRLRDQLYATRPPAEQAEYREARKAEDSNFAEFRNLPPVPDVPMVVLLAGMPAPLPAGFVFPGDYKAFSDEHLRQAIEHANQWRRQVSEGWLLVTPNSGHYIQDTEPDLVVWGIRRALFPDVGRRLMRTSEKGGSLAVLRLYRELKAFYPENSFKPDQLNHVGYSLLRSNKLAGAIEIFRLNVEMFPRDWNVYDSLAEAYAAQGNRDLAIENYEKSLELNPRNDNGKQMILKLKSR